MARLCWQVERDHLEILSVYFLGDAHPEVGGSGVDVAPFGWRREVGRWLFKPIAIGGAKPGLVATSLLVLILAWNEYLLALFLSTANAQTIPILVAAQNATRGPQWWYMSVLIIIMILPVILLTLLLQRFIAKGLLLGAVKG